MLALTTQGMNSIVRYTATQQGVKKFDDISVGFPDIRKSMLGLKSVGIIARVTMISMHFRWKRKQKWF